jgi:hypothetical protein
MLISLQQFGALVRLVPGSGIQFLDFGLNLNESKTVLQFQSSAAGSTLPVRAFPDPNAEGEFVDARGIRIGGEVYSITGAKAFESFLERWIPLPFLRLRDRSQLGEMLFADGPANWTRMRIVALAKPDSTGNSHRITLAFDTALLPRHEGRPYIAPTTDDATTGAEFALANTAGSVGWFLEQEWVGEWLLDAAKRSSAAQRQARRAAGAETFAAGEHLARYLTLLEVLNTRLGIPRIGFVDTVSPTSRISPVNVDFVLDIGNSRSCGMIIESLTGEGVDLNETYSLELRDLTDPSQVHTGPFPSRIEFAQSSFGSERLSRRGGRFNCLTWPSVTRVGFEAERLSNMLTGTEGNSGLSSPKRYLWDTAPRGHEWCFNRNANPDSASTPLVSSLAYVQRFREDGELLKGAEQPPMSALFSRSSLMTFYLYEVLLHVLTIMNSPAKRYQRRYSDVPRQLNRVILTIPTAMVRMERELFAKRAKAAINVLWSEVVLAEGAWRSDQKPPELLIQWDEATGTQAVFLYSEIKNNFNGDALDFFKCSGRVRPGDEVPSLRIASIDIGGGTTDLIITTYRLEGNVSIVPKQDFREGVSFAGDDLTKGIIERHIILDLRKAMRAAGVENAAEICETLFGDNRAGMTELEKTLRKLFANQIFRPIALHITHHYENYEPISGSQVIPPFKLADIDAQPAGAVIAYLENAARKPDGQPFRFADLEFRIDLADIDRSVGRLMHKILNDFAEVIHLYGCDYLLLSGRPSRMPAVRFELLTMLSAMADRIYSMHRYRAGNWYPYRDAAGRLSDPKTTAAVGGMVCALSDGQLTGFYMRSRDMKAVSTARYLGEVEQTDQILTRKIFFSDVDLENPRRHALSHTFDFYAPIFIGYRQLAVERWTATRLYRMDFANPHDAQKLALPLKVTIEQTIEEDEDTSADRVAFSITDVTDSEGNPFARSPLIQRLQTLKTEAGYWIDTGIFDIPSSSIDKPSSGPQ